MRRRSAILLVSAVGAAAAVALPSIQTKQAIGDTKITHVAVEEAPVALGPSAAVTLHYEITATDDSGIRSVSPVGLWSRNYGVIKASKAECTAVSHTTSVCRGTAVANSTARALWNDNAGWWNIQAQANANDGDHYSNEKAGYFLMRRSTETVVYGVPQEAKAGQRVDVGGQLTQADWPHHQMVPAPDQHAVLKFKPQGSDAYRTVASVGNQPDGTMSATVTISGTGSYAWFYPGSPHAAPSRSTDAQVTVAG
jgi:hypothetical protein